MQTKGDVNEIRRVKLSLTGGITNSPVSHYAVAYLIERLSEMGFDYSDLHTHGQVCWSESLEGQHHLTRLD